MEKVLNFQFGSALLKKANAGEIWIFIRNKEEGLTLDVKDMKKFAKTLEAFAELCDKD